MKQQSEGIKTNVKQIQSIHSADNIVVAEGSYGNSTLGGNLASRS